MNTLVQFLGLIIITTLETATGLHVIMPHFTDLEPAHVSYIAYRPADLSSAVQWPSAGSFSYQSETYNWVAVHNEVVSFTGSSEAFGGSADDLPHLTCCCAAMQAGLQSQYKDPSLPATQRKASHFFVTNGTASIVAESSGALSTHVSMAAAQGITLSTESGKSLTFNAGAHILIGNDPLPGSPATGSHFHAYYTTGIDPLAPQCTSTPTTNPSTCGPRPSGCDLPTKLITAVLGARATASPAFTSADCSNTHFP
jgi:hypothetical protein